MPLYEYRCLACQGVTEALVRSACGADSLAPACPACGGPMERQWAPVAAPARSGGNPGCAPRGGFT